MAKKLWEFYTCNNKKRCRFERGKEEKRIGIRRTKEVSREKPKNDAIEECDMILKRVNSGKKKTQPRKKGRKNQVEEVEIKGEEK